MWPSTVDASTAVATPMVVDASVFIDALTFGRRSPAARRALSSVAPVVPSSIDLEIISALARLERAGQVSTDEADVALSHWIEIDVERVDLPPLLATAWRSRAYLRPADGLYVALAAGTSLTLLTSDARLARAPIRDVTISLVT